MMSRPARRRFRGAKDSLCSFCHYLSLGILTRTREFPFLVSALSIFLIANISMISKTSRVFPPHKASKKTAHSIIASREPKSDAKLQPPRKPAKHFGENFSKITSFNRNMAFLGRFRPKNAILCVAAPSLILASACQRAC